MALLTIPCDLVPIISEPQIKKRTSIYYLTDRCRLFFVSFVFLSFPPDLVIVVVIFLIVYFLAVFAICEHW